MIEKIKSHKVKPSADVIIEKLLETNSIETIAHILASIVSEESEVYGKDKIGRTLSDISKLMERVHEERRGGGRSRNRGGNSNYKGGNRNRSGGGERSGNRSGGERDRNGGGGHRGGNRNSGKPSGNRDRG